MSGMCPECRLKDAEIGHLRAHNARMAVSFVTNQQVFKALRDEIEKLKAERDARISIELFQIERGTGDRLREDNTQLRLRVKELEINCPAQAALDEIEKLQRDNEQLRAEIKALRAELAAALSPVRACTKEK